MFFACRWISKFLRVDIIVFHGSNQTCPKYPKQEVSNFFAIYEEKGIETAFLFYFDAKYSDILWGVQKCPLLLVVIYLYTCLMLGGCGQNGHRLLDVRTLKSNIYIYIYIYPENKLMKGG